MFPVFGLCFLLYYTVNTTGELLIGVELNHYTSANTLTHLVPNFYTKIQAG